MQVLSFCHVKYLVVVNETLQENVVNGKNSGVILSSSIRLKQ